jgi:hypothetical protein
MRDAPVPGPLARALLLRRRADQAAAPLPAERFTVSWERLADTAYHPWGDVVTVVGFLDDLRSDWGSERLLVEDMLARAMAELGG